MNVTVTRKEVNETKQLIDELSKWEPFTKTSDAANGQVILKLFDGRKEHGAGGYLGSRYESPQDDLQPILNKHIAAMAKEVCEKIKSLMPIPIND